ncbi:MAG: DUF7133 domain-containing protein [Planctomycetota bacterium]|jgi:mono/diheme cytochrome c family protein/glucose/arabinose dehydrogenase
MPLPPLVLALALSCAAAGPLAAQRGDQEGEVQPMVDRRWFVPPAPALSPAEAAARFQLPQGYRIEAVAVEPLVRDPVDVAWDERGRMWVVEMTTLMLDADGTGELDPSCEIAVLSDTDGDGRYDHREVFLDGLVLPRSVCFIPEGVVAILPPRMVFLQDLDGDGRPDREEVLAEGMEAGLHNPEHAPNSLVVGIDNWIYVANHDRRYRRLQDGTWVSEPSARGGQWGQSQDDWGRLVYNYNSSAPHVNLLPPAAVMRNPAHGRAAGTNIATSGDRGVDSARVNAGVNRGYRAGTLAADGRLASLTGACAPAWFTGTWLSPRDRGRIFVCEPAANVVQRLDVEEVGGRIRTARLKRERDGLDFLTSTDERFRPVNLRVGPDGALYVVDLYRGILQHKVFMTSYLRRQVEERGLEEPTGWGRIWRITHADGEESLTTDLAQLDDDALFRTLDHPNAWQRHTAQRLLIERIRVDGGPDRDLMDRLLPRWLEASGPTPLGDLHARAVVEEFRFGQAGEVTPEEGLTEAEAETIRTRPTARWTAAIDLGDQEGVAKVRPMLEILALDPEDDILRGALLSGLDGVELEALLGVLGAGEGHPLRRDSKGNRAMLADLAACVLRRGDGARVATLLDLAAAIEEPWRTAAILDGLVKALPGGRKDPQRLDVPAPAALDSLRTRPALVPRLDALAAGLTWSDRPARPRPTGKGATAEFLALGEQVYAASCLACHQPDGAGLAGLAPPLRGSEWLDLPDQRLADIALHGLSGPIQVAGEDWDLSMPGWSSLDDEEIAAALSYIRDRWSPAGSGPVSAETVAEARAAGPGSGR